MDIRPARKGLWRRISLVWIVPVLVLIVSLGVAWQAYVDRGTVIEISFENASGITAETQIKYRDINVGHVEKVSFAEGLDVVIVRARVDKEIAPYLDDDAEFWVVRPDVSVRGISGLETVLSGV
jgi:paraquat-inducible protein B